MMVEQLDDINYASHKITPVEPKKTPLRKATDSVELSRPGEGGDKVKRIGRPMIYSSEFVENRTKTGPDAVEGMERYRQMVYQAEDLNAEERAELRDNNLNMKDAGMQRLWRIVTGNTLV